MKSYTQKLVVSMAMATKTDKTRTIPLDDDIVPVLRWAAKRAGWKKHGNKTEFKWLRGKKLIQVSVTKLEDAIVLETRSISVKTPNPQLDLPL